MLATCSAADVAPAASSSSSSLSPSLNAPTNLSITWSQYLAGLPAPPSTTTTTSTTTAAAIASTEAPVLLPLSQYLSELEKLATVTATADAPLTKCYDTIAAFACPGVRSSKHLISIEGAVDPNELRTVVRIGYGLLAVKTSPDGPTECVVFAQFKVQMFRNTLCNNLDTYNDVMDSRGQPRVRVTAIDSRTEITHDSHGVLLDSADPDKMLTLFFQLAGTSSKIVVLGDPQRLYNDADAQRCLRKAAEHEARVLKDRIASIDDKHLHTIKGLEDAQEVLMAEVAALKSSDAHVGVKRARTEHGDMHTTTLVGKLFQSLSQALEEKSRLESTVFDLQPMLAKLQEENFSLRASLAQAGEQGRKFDVAVVELQRVYTELQKEKGCVRELQKENGSVRASLSQLLAEKKSLEATLVELQPAFADLQQENGNVRASLAQALEEQKRLEAALVEAQPQENGGAQGDGARKE